MRLGERLAAAIKRLTKKRPAPQAVSLPKKREGASASWGKGADPLLQGSAAQAPANRAAMPSGTAKQPVSTAAAVPKGTADQGASPAGGPRAKKTAAPKTSGETAPKRAAASLPEGSAGQVPPSGAAMPSGTAKRPVSDAASVPKGPGEASPRRLQAAEVKGSAQTALDGGQGAMPKGSWQSLPQAGTGRRTETGGGSFSTLTEEIALTGPPRDPARELSELLRTQRRMNPSATSFGEDVL